MDSNDAAPPTDMSAEMDAVELAAAWRARAAYFRETKPEHWDGMALGYSACAADLEAGFLAPPSDAAPVAWRWRWWPGGWSYSHFKPTDISAGAEIQPLYAHPEDAAPVDCENCKTLEQWVHDCQAGMYINCVYCGYRYGPDDEVAPTMQQALYDHIAECPKHPLSAMKRRAERAEARLAHPEDAPGGPWEIFKSCEGWNVRSASFRPWTEKQATAVRDVLNRLKGETE